MKIIITEQGVEFTPEVTLANFQEAYKLILDSIPTLVLSVLQAVPMLRPPMEIERDNNLYVFQEGEQGVQENRLYDWRKASYTVLSSIFSTILSTAFPDIEYINECDKQHQSMMIDSEEGEQYLDNVKKLTAIVRERMDEYLKELYEVAKEAMESPVQEAETKV